MIVRRSRQVFCRIRIVLRRRRSQGDQNEWRDMLQSERAADRLGVQRVELARRRIVGGTEPTWLVAWVDVALQGRIARDAGERLRALVRHPTDVHKDGIAIGSLQREDEVGAE